jgi:hypothetical protein
LSALRQIPITQSINNTAKHPRTSQKEKLDEKSMLINQMFIEMINRTRATITA